ncbi:MAG: DUF1573 domain-containing protein [Planctomycetaceae bacterium]|nr:DUF1573 domain-containing protein [Planctomycetaceae bacterium]
MLGTFHRFGLSLLLLAGIQQTAVAQGSWASQLVDTEKVDFGVVATGSDVLKVITIRNTLNSQVHISSVQKSCSCLIYEGPATTLLQPGEETTIQLSMDTRKFKHKRDVTLSIYFDAPQFAEVRIPVSAYIRTDVVFEPGRVQFGSVAFGEGGQQTVNIAYAGRSDWKITDVKISNPDIAADLKETTRAAGRIDYNLTVKLDAKARPGRIRDLITLVTDDSANPYVPLIVEGTVVPEFTMTPSLVQIRPLKAGETTTVRVVVKGRRPFLIEDVDCRDMQDCFRVKLSERPNVVQIVDLEFVATEKAGSFTQELFVKIADREEPVPFRVTGTIN